ncbi:hypothetical protein [Zhihengliuella salsuginis]|uniref:SdpI/YhfL protein family protein n=1 Tax=Zhihengliuella salsuginis TaxID=578222 RepID=A0ABQ3GGZ3_9MICC|nr:hypothetical protein [Zhihengliuella salsuginis]GHD06133.1 hypothetical protein GCM10008096_15740 [Zhihengliuella salsuginis]
MLDTLISFFFIGILPAILGWVYAWLAWSGRYRRWVRTSAIAGIPPMFSWHKRNYWPFLSAAIGTGWMLMWAFSAVDYLYPDQDVLAETLLMVGVGIILVLGSWWPEAWRPQWHKDWVARGGDRNRTGTPLFSDEELIDRGKLPHGAAEKIQRQQERAARKKRR